MKLETILYTILLLLMYLPFTAIHRLQGATLYTYWTLVAMATLLLAWYHTWRWSEK